MALQSEKIENRMGSAKAGVRKWMKAQRNRLIRRTPIEEEPEPKKYKGWEY